VVSEELEEEEQHADQDRNENQTLYDVEEDETTDWESLTNAALEEVPDVDEGES